MERYLVRDGFAVVTCASGREGIRRARELRPRAITLDVMMPEMDGWAVLREIKEDPKLARTPVIMVTMLEDREIGYALGAAEYLVKPVSKEELRTVLRRYRGDAPPWSVLVIEDDPAMRQLLHRVLEREGWNVREAENGLAGLRRMEESDATLILLDLMMPEMDGFEFLHELCKRDAWREIPVIVITAKILTPEDRRRLSGNVDRILQKGAYSRQELLQEVRDLVSLRVRGRSPSRT